MSAILAIARDLADLENRHALLDDIASDPDTSEADVLAAEMAAGLVDDRAELLALTLDVIPATSLAEAAVQLLQLGRLAGALHALDLSPQKVIACGERMERLALSALPHVAAAAALDVEALGWAPTLRLRARRFGALAEDV